jgi:hypothetical protein
LLDQFTLRRDFRDRSLRTALYTPGVLASLGHPSYQPEEVIRQFAVLDAHGWKPTFLRIDDREAPLARAVADAGWAVEDNREIRWEDFGSYLQQFGHVVSGRYHVLVFAAMAGVPATALPSNTWKIDGLIELLGGQIACAESADDLATICRLAPPHTIDWPVIRACQAEARSTLPESVSPNLSSRIRPRVAANAPANLSWRTALFGASTLGRDTASRLRRLPHLELTGFLDNDPAKWGARQDDLPVAAPTQETLAAADLIVITSMHDVQIRAQVIEAGFGHKLTNVDELERVAAPPRPSI